MCRSLFVTAKSLLLRHYSYACYFTHEINFAFIYESCQVLNFVISIKVGAPEPIKTKPKENTGSVDGRLTKQCWATQTVTDVFASCWKRCKSEKSVISFQKERKKNQKSKVAIGRRQGACLIVWQRADLIRWVTSVTLTTRYWRLVWLRIRNCPGPCDNREPRTGRGWEFLEEKKKKNGRNKNHECENNVIRLHVDMWGIRWLQEYCCVHSV